MTRPRRLVRAPIRAWVCVCADGMVHVWPTGFALYMLRAAALESRENASTYPCGPHRVVELVERPGRRKK